MADPQTLSQGQPYMGGTVGFDSSTGQPLAPGATTSSVGSTTPTQTPTPTQVPQNTPSGTPSSMSDTSFMGVLTNLNSGLQQNNSLVDQKNLIQKQMFDQPLSQDELNKLPPDVRSIVQSGDPQKMALQLQIVNDSLQGRNNSIASSIQGLTTGWEQAQTKYNQDVTNVLNYAKALNAKPSDVMKALYPAEAARLGTQLDTLNAPLLTTSQTPEFTSMTGTAGYDLSSYASAPGYVDDVSTIGSTIGTISTPQDAQNYIESNFPNSPITGDMITSAANQYGVDPTTLMAILQKESQFASDGSKGATMNNPGNVGNSDSAMAAGTPTSYPSMQDGVNAVADWLSNHKVQANIVDALPPEGSTANTPDQYTGLTPNGIYQASLDWAFAGKMIPTGIGTAPIPRAIRASVINKAAAIATAAGTSFPSMQALYKANASAAKQNVERLARVESVLQATTLNFPRLEQLADSIKSQGINLTESDIQSGAATVLAKTGSQDAASYIELINTIRSDYSAAQAALAGSRGGQFFADSAAHAIPTGYTSQQYESVKNTLSLSSNNAVTAINGEVQSLLGISGGTGQNKQQPSSDTTFSSDVLKSIKLDDTTKTATIPRSIWSTLGSDMDALLSEMKKEGYDLKVTG